MVDFQSQVIQSLQEGETARGDLRQLLRLSPKTTLELTTDLDFRRIDPDIGKLRAVALDLRPDIKARRFTYSQRESDLKLRRPTHPRRDDRGRVCHSGTAGAGQSPAVVSNLGVPFPLFNRNQGGILQERSHSRLRKPT